MKYIIAAIISALLLTGVAYAAGDQYLHTILVGKAHITRADIFKYEDGGVTCYVVGMAEGFGSIGIDCLKK